LSQEEAEAWDL